MLNLERQNAILQYITKKHSATVSELSKQLYVSEATVRRDLSIMDRQGILKRSHGGAVIFESSGTEISFQVREQTYTKEKRQIAELAALFLSHSRSIFIDSSSTSGMLIPHMSRMHGICVITTGLKNAILLSETTDAKIYLPGGIVNSNSNSVIGIDTQSYLAHMNPDIAFFSCSGIDAAGNITDGTLEQALLKRQVIINAKKRILLCDSSKFLQGFLCKICDFTSINYIVTDKMPNENMVNTIKTSGCEIMSYK